MSNHAWVENDDLMILFVHKYGVENSPLSKQQIADVIGVSLGSVSYRLGNFIAIEGEGAATHFAQLSFDVYQQYSVLPMQQLRELTFGQ